MKMFDNVLGSDNIRRKFMKRFRVPDIHDYLNKDVERFREISTKYFLY
jgi:uncharacterized protein YbbC (DUF1343 family)